MKSIVNLLKTEDFTRVRVGIGMPERKTDLINYVIGHISDSDNEILQKGIDKAVLAIEDIMKNGIDDAMNKYNGKK